MEEHQDYSRWSHEELISRVTSLERQLKEQTVRAKSSSTTSKLPSPPRIPKNARVNREIDRSRYSTRFIALKFAYLGQRYNGLEFHPNNKTPLPTVEEELWKALNKARLVFPNPNPLLEPGEPNWEGCEYSKCGRTDKGVSAFGQVIGIQVRSNRPVQHASTGSPVETPDEGIGEEALPARDNDATIESSGSPREIGPAKPSSTTVSPDEDPAPFDPVSDEIPYCQILNRLLPPDIRMLAWCPIPPPNFSARFSCRERRYKYFFTQPAFTPTPGPACLSSSRHLKTPNERRREGWLDIPAMRKAAHAFVGLHDFRNFCKVDPSKQIENFERRITYAEIEAVDLHQHPLGYVSQPAFSELASPSSNSTPPHNTPSECTSSTPKIYTLTLHGSAFLWHQVRHMAAILFLIGQSLEPPSLVSDLLDIRKTPCKPQYEMADDAPLVLWDCKFPDESKPGENVEALEWIYVGGEKGMGTGRNGRFGLGGVVDEMWRVWRERKIDEVLAGSLLDVIIAQGGSESDNEHSLTTGEKKSQSQRVFLGGDGAKLGGRYVPIMQRPRMESVAAVNAKYAKRKGFETREEVRERGFRQHHVDKGEGVDE